MIVGTFLGLCIGGLLAATSRGDDLLAASLAQEKAARAAAVAPREL